MDVTPATSTSARRGVRRAVLPPAGGGEGPLAFEVALDEDLAPNIVTDEQRLQQILRNLLSNAVKFTESGGVTLRISAAPRRRLRDASLAEADDVIAFCVTDTGIGIAEERLDLIFEAFQQADGTTSRRFGGTGLGLSISREIAHLGGRDRGRVVRRRRPHLHALPPGSWSEG